MRTLLKNNLLKMKFVALAILFVTLIVSNCHAWRRRPNWEDGQLSSSTTSSSSTTTTSTTTTPLPYSCGAEIVRTKPGTCPRPPNVQCIDCIDSCTSDANCAGQMDICCEHPCGNYCRAPLERSSN
ncbi:unnamed protein product [Orchesella dallaii]|uniref:WAP domain-containing protein n=1 Tax=Orchesella dallaii TaxID=48710 RepID=A0ABP1R4J8_9HEXA